MATGNKILPWRDYSMTSNKENEWDVVIVGAGAAGLLAAAASAARGRRTVVLEKNRKTGVKILMSGGTRCNITHDCSPQEIAVRFGHARRFLEFAMGRLPPADVVRLINKQGVATKVESTGKIFPVSDRALDVRDALVRHAVRAGARIINDCAVLDVDDTGRGWQCQTADRSFTCNSLVLTTGGKSYPGCGTTGDGYAWAQKFGHTMVDPRPALTPLVADETWIRELTGMTLERCAATALDPAGIPVDSRTESSLLFTHWGLSGPLAMNLSRWFTLDQGRASHLEIDFLPKIPGDKWISRFNEYAVQHGKQQISNYRCPPLPPRLLHSLLSEMEISGDLKLAEFGKRRTQLLGDAIHRCRVPITGTKGFAKAEVTAGGIALSEVDHRTMRSHCHPRLYFAGEILDLDGPIGGFNFQAAFSTGQLAGQQA